MTAIVGTTIYYFGDDPEGFKQLLQQAIDDGLFDNIEGLESITISDDLTATNVAPTDPPATTATTQPGGSGGDGTGGDGTGGGGGTGGDGTGGDGSGGDGTGGDGTGGDGTGGDGTNGIVSGERSVDDGLSAGVAVAIAGGGLLFCLLCLFVMGRGRGGNRDDDSDFSNVQSTVKHRQLTEDEDEVPPGEEEKDILVTRVRSNENKTRELYADDPKIAHIVGENDSSYMAATFGPSPTIEDEEKNDLPSDEELFEHHGPNESCSSPSCAMCEARRQQGPTFVRTTDNLRVDSDEGSGEDPARQYTMADTVDL